MGRGWEPSAKTKGNGRGSGSRSWGYWPGSWASPRSRSWGKERGQEWQTADNSSFPAYDTKARATAMKKGQQAKDSSAPTQVAVATDPADCMTSDLQEHINSTRRAEQKVRSLQTARQQKDQLWQQWQDDMKASFLKEEARYQKATE